jgi:hypothetical protein
MAAMNMVSAVEFLGVGFHSRICPQGVTSVLGKKPPIFGSRQSKLDDLTVYKRGKLYPYTYKNMMWAKETVASFREPECYRIDLGSLAFKIV